MSSILIKGMEMPYCCVVCPFKEMYNDGLLCKATTPHQYIPKFLHKRNEKCPFVEVPTSHGDLIDREKVKELLLDLWKAGKDYSIAVIIREIVDIPTIIEAEE